MAGREGDIEIRNQNSGKEQKCRNEEKDFYVSKVDSQFSRFMPCPRDKKDIKDDADSEKERLEKIFNKYERPDERRIT